MTKVDDRTGIAYVNAAIVPRILHEDEFEAEQDGPLSGAGECLEAERTSFRLDDEEVSEEIDGDGAHESVGSSNTVHHFTCVELSLTEPVKCVRGVDVWIRVIDGVDGGGKHVVRARTAKMVCRHEFHEALVPP